MFEDLNQITEVNPAKRFLTVVTSIAIHFLGVIIVVVIPLVVFQQLPQSELLTFLVAPPPPPPAPVAPPPPPTSARPVSAKVTVVDPSKFVAPSSLPTEIPTAPDEIPVVATGNYGAGVPGGVSGGIAGPGVSSAITGGLVKEVQTSSAPPPLPTVTKKREALKIGGDLQESKLIKKVVPEYPPLAQRMRLSGTVILLVTIDEEGNVTDVKPQSGHPVLQKAAIEAVSKWKYSPTVLNGEPISIQGTVRVIFNSKVQ